MPEPPVPSDAALPTPQREHTLLDLLMSAWSADNGRDWNRRAVARETARSPVGAIHLAVQVAALEAYDPWAHVPAALVIRAYTNNEFGLDFTRESILRVRGRVCEYLDIDTAAADKLTLTRVAEVLREAAAPGRAPGDDPMAEFRWLKVTQVARLFDLNPGQVSKWTDAGTYKSNGRTGTDRRIDVLSVIRHRLDGLTVQAAVDDALAERPGP